MALRFYYAVIIRERRSTMIVMVMTVIFGDDDDNDDESTKERLKEDNGLQASECNEDACPSSSSCPGEQLTRYEAVSLLAESLKDERMDRWYWWMNGWTDGCTVGWIDEWMDEWIIIINL